MTVIIDIDSTLVEFSELLYQEIVRLGYKCPPTYAWYEWATPHKAVNNDKLFYQLVNNVHRNLCNLKPFPLASELMQWLHERYYVIVATHRNNEFIPSVHEWLSMNDLPHDLVHVSNDKTKLFESAEHIEFIFDDCPMTSSKAAQKGIQTYQLWYPYNRGCAMTFYNIGHFLGYLMKKEADNEF